MCCARLSHLHSRYHCALSRSPIVPDAVLPSARAMQSIALPRLKLNRSMRSMTSAPVLSVISGSALSHEQTSASHRPTGEKRSQEPPGDPTPMHCHRSTPNQRPNALTRPTAVMAACRFLLAMPLAFSGFNGPMSKAVHSDFKGMERLSLGVVPVRPSPRVAEKSGRRPSRAHPPQNRRRSESLRSCQASPLDPDAGFTVQCINADHAVNNGDRIFGYKLATSPQVGGLAVGRAVAHPVFRRSRRRWCCAGGHGVQPIVWCGICPPVIRHQSQN